MICPRGAFLQLLIVEGYFHSIYHHMIVHENNLSFLLVLLVLVLESPLLYYVLLHQADHSQLQSAQAQGSKLVLGELKNLKSHGRKTGVNKVTD